MSESGAAAAPAAHPADAGEWPGRTVLVAGARGDIGEGLCRQFLDRGATVVGVSRRAPGLEHPRFRYVAADLSAERPVVELYRALDKEGLTPDALVVNFALSSAGMALLLVEAEIDRLLSNNLRGPLLVMREAAKRMARRRFGRIVAISSVRVAQPVRGSLLYSVTKAGLEQAVRGLAVELADSGVTCNAVAVSLTESGMAQGLSDDARRALLDSLTIKRPCSAADIGNAVDFFCRSASAYVTGQVLKLGFI